MSVDLLLVEKYLQQSIDEFDVNPLVEKFMRGLLNDAPDLFCKAAIKHLDSNEWSNAQRFLATLLARQDGLLDYLASPAFGTRESAVRLFKRFQEVDPSFDVRLARRLPGCYDSNDGFAFDTVSSTRALDILDETSHGRRLLDILGHLSQSDDPKIAAKATLFVGRRVHNPAWTKRQLERKDNRIRANAVEALWGINTAPVIQLLEECTRDANNRVVGNALVGLYIAGSQQAENEVLTLSKSGKPDLRSTAAWVMGRLAVPSFRARLTELVQDKVPRVRAAALRALVSVRRLEANTIEEISANASGQPAEVIDAKVKKAFDDIQRPSQPGPPDLALEGSSIATPSHA